MVKMSVPELRRLINRRSLDNKKGWADRNKTSDYRAEAKKYGNCEARTHDLWISHNPNPMRLTLYFNHFV
jgi:hypothetical protein